MGPSLKLSLTLFSVAVILKLTFGSNQMCITVHKSLNQLYIDGVKANHQLPRNIRNEETGCIEVPPNAGVIALQASNYGGYSGTARLRWRSAAQPTLFDSRGWLCDWRVGPAEASQWYKPDFNDKDWKRARQFMYKTKCSKQKQGPCGWLEWMWTHKTIRRKVYCRLKLCADNCNGCKNAGPGKCDPGKCKWDSGTSSVTGETSCNSRCKLEVKAWGTSGIADGYIRVTDIATNYVDTWTANNPGHYMGVVDMNTCSVIDRQYVDWPNEPSMTTLYNTWNANASYENVIGVQVAVGPSATTGPPFGSYAPFIAVGRLAVGNGDPDVLNARDMTFSGVLTGVQNDFVTVTNIIVT